MGKFQGEKPRSTSLRFPGTFSHKEATPSFPIPGLAVPVGCQQQLCPTAGTAARQKGQWWAAWPSWWSLEGPGRERGSAVLPLAHWHRSGRFMPVASVSSAVK